MWYKMTGERFGHNGCRSVMVEIESPEAIGAFDLVEVTLTEALPVREPVAFVPRNASGMDQREYVIDVAERSADAKIRDHFRHAKWFRAKVHGTYVENGRTYGVVVGVLLAKILEKIA